MLEEQVGVDRVVDRDPRRLLILDRGLALDKSWAGRFGQAKVEREGKRVSALRPKAKVSLNRSKCACARGLRGPAGAGLTEPLRLFTRSSSPSREVSAGREMEGPMMDPSAAFLNWATIVGAGAERSIVLAEGIVRCRLGGGGICVDIKTN